MTNSTSELSSKVCKPCVGGVYPLEQSEVNRLLQELEGWEQIGSEIAKVYQFKNYYETMAFVNATAWISHEENHHPDLEVGYRQCRVRYTTHDISGLSENDFICAAKIDHLIIAKS